MSQTYVDRDLYSDCGFTSQTETLLRGLGASALIPGCKKRNVSTSALHKLTRDDFIVLGADEKQADYLINQLNIEKKSVELVFPKRSDNLIDILKHGQQQLSLLQAYMAYCRIRLKKVNNNFYVDADKNLCATEVLCIAADEALQDLQSVQDAIHELENSIHDRKNGNTWKPFYVRCCLIIGMSFAAYATLRIYKNPLTVFNFLHFK